VSLKLSLIGGGGFRTPLVYQALLDQRATLRVEQFVLHDTDPQRLALMERVLGEMTEQHDAATTVTTTTDLVEAVSDADFVMCAIRVGGLEGRVIDESVPLGNGVLGQETTGPGGLCFAMRTLPVITDIAQTVARHAPKAWFVNFTNPAGLVTEALRDVMGDRVVGICDSPAALCRRVSAALGRDPAGLRFDYAGLNHLGWLTAAHDGQADLLPGLIADDARLAQVREAELFGLEWIRALEIIPNEYLSYYYYTSRVLEALESRRNTRGEYLLEQQQHFYRDGLTHPGGPLAAWRAARVERSGTYMAEAGRHTNDTPAGEDELAEATSLGGYGAVATAFISAVATDKQDTLILNTVNGSSVDFLDAESVVEVPCRVGSSGPKPLATGRLPEHAAGLMLTVKEVERLTIEAVRQRSPRLAVKALALHPLVQSVDTARTIFAAYLQQHAALRELFT
jgi:6-phospho-beta-glucosidase